MVKKKRAVLLCMQHCYRTGEVYPLNQFFKLQSKLAYHFLLDSAIVSRLVWQCCKKIKLH